MSSPTISSTLTSRPDSDVDVLVITDDADHGALGMATMEAGMMLGRDIDLKPYVR